VVAGYITSRPGRSIAPTVDGRIRLDESCFPPLP
jgi:hypothetical protein